MRYSVDLRQFNNHERYKVSFVLFEQAVSYGLHKLQESVDDGVNIIKALTIKGPRGRRIIVIPQPSDTVEKPEEKEATSKMVIEIATNKQNEGYFLF